jgi:NAD/NADP transhydrogenase beta subunit
MQARTGEAYASIQPSRRWLCDGANGDANPAAREDSTWPIFGMPVLEVSKAGMVMFIRRSLA